MKYSLYRLQAGIFLLKIKGRYQLANTFLRCQEFYESINPEIRGKTYKLKDYKTWYTRNLSKYKRFSYADDTLGFNIPSKVIEKCYSLNVERNNYDRFFLRIFDRCKSLAKESGLKNFYIIGVRDSDRSNSIDHEFAHGLYYVSPEYRKATNKLIKEFKPDLKKHLVDKLRDLGYCAAVYNDEIQAYLSTGPHNTMDHKKIPRFEKKFKKVFDKYKELLAIKKELIERDL